MHALLGMKVWEWENGNETSSFWSENEIHYTHSLNYYTHSQHISTWMCTHTHHYLSVLTILPLPVLVNSETFNIIIIIHSQSFCKVIKFITKCLEWLVWLVAVGGGVGKGGGEGIQTCRLDHRWVLGEAVSEWRYMSLIKLNPLFCPCTPEFKFSP